MAITLRLHTDEKTLYLPRLSSRLSGTARLQTGDYVVIDNFAFVVTGFVHHLSDISNDVAPVTYCDVRPRSSPYSDRFDSLSNEDVLKLKMLGFKE